MQRLYESESNANLLPVASADPFIDRIPYGTFMRLASTSNTYHNLLQSYPVQMRKQRSSEAWSALGNPPSKRKAIIWRSDNPQDIISALQHNFQIDVLDVSDLWKSMTIDLAVALHVALRDEQIHDVITRDFWVDRSDARSKGNRSYLVYLVRQIDQDDQNDMLMEMMKSKKVSAGFMWLVLNRMTVLEMRSSDNPPSWSPKFEEALTNNTTIHKLDLSNTYSNESDGQPMQYATKQALARVVEHGMPNLEILNLAECFMGNIGANRLLEALENRKENLPGNRLRKVVLAHNGIDDDDDLLSNFESFEKKYYGEGFFTLYPQGDADSEFEASEDDSDDGDDGDDSDA